MVQQQVRAKCLRRFHADLQPDRAEARVIDAATRDRKYATASFKIKPTAGPRRLPHVSIMFRIFNWF
ncbi:MAG: hypothetical protein IID33_15805 [Planctomycetes bacterium]|nr:hypothetical protein [Planctomycetota bacterium]